MGLSFTAVLGLPIAAASLVEEHRLWVCGLQYLLHVGPVVAAHGLIDHDGVITHLEPDMLECEVR